MQKGMRNTKPNVNVKRLDIMMNYYYYNEIKQWKNRFRRKSFCTKINLDDGVRFADRFMCIINQNFIMSVHRKQLREIAFGNLLR